MHYDLLHEPWIPCETQDGELRKLGIRDVLVHGQDYRALVDDSPLVTLALHRLLLAILHRVVDGPATTRDWVACFRRGHFLPEAVDAYLKGFADRFDLFSDTYPFYQLAGLEQDKTAPVTKLAQELSAGNNPTLFDHTTDGDGEYWAPDVCARWLVTAQAFALGGGISGKSNRFGKHPNYTHGPLVGTVLALILGNTLFETLALNLPLYPDDQAIPRLGDDRPCWERPDSGEAPVARAPEGWLDLLTWQARCIRLLPEDGKRGVRDMYVAQGLAREDQGIFDPMSFYREGKTPDENRTIRLDPAKALWRDADALYSLVPMANLGRHRCPKAFSLLSTVLDDEDLPPEQVDGLRSLLVGLANDKAKALSWAREVLPLSRSLLRDPGTNNTVTRAVELCERAGEAVHACTMSLARDLLDYDPGKMGRSSDAKVVSSMAKSFHVDEAYWGALDLPFRRFIDGVSVEPETAMARWQDCVMGTARSAFETKRLSSCAMESARGIRAVVRVRGTLEGRLKKLLSEGGKTNA